MEDLTSIRFFIAVILAAIGGGIAFGPELLASLSRLRRVEAEESPLGSQTSAAN